ncbi:MAG: amidohydrolase family protein [Acidimicrobiia bacterium]|nr:amidohydrolase family protein [Acidimicrobiia bacterium]MDH5293318.1 amidohydrolase family protein [Acidimicrobiia bacterium]MDH5521168.1 amidohydrolase family protein [Acidimicrobiia bacterium]
MTVLRSGTLAGGRCVDVTTAGGRIVSVEPATGVVEGDEIDLGGRLLLPSMGEPHAHLDKAFTADLVPNPQGDLDGAVEAILAAWPTISVENIVERGERAVRRLVASGTTAIRSHADVTPEGEQKSVIALAEVKARTAHLCDLELVALTMPLSGVDGALGRRRLVQALEGGVDVVGACPHLDEDPLEAIDNALDAAVDAGTRVDLHFDEVLDVSVQHLPELARRVEARGLGGKVVASHCVSHGLLSPDRQREVGRLLADAGVAVVANPRTNLFLQSRGIEAATPRGLAGVRALLESGVVVAAGADNVQDPFYVIGRSDPLETAALLVSVAHLTVDEAWTLVSSAVREVMGLEGVAVEVGAPADLIAASGASIREVIADQPADRMVFRRGELVSRTSVETWVA